MLSRLSGVFPEVWLEHTTPFCNSKEACLWTCQVAPHIEGAGGLRILQPLAKVTELNLPKPEPTFHIECSFWPFVPASPLAHAYFHSPVSPRRAKRQSWQRQESTGFVNCVAWLFIFKSKILPPTKAQIHVGLMGPGDFHSVAFAEMSSSPYPRVGAGSAGGCVSISLRCFSQGLWRTLLFQQKEVPDNGAPAWRCEVAVSSVERWQFICQSVRDRQRINRDVLNGSFCWALSSISMPTAILSKRLACQGYQLEVCVRHLSILSSPPQEEDTSSVSALLLGSLQMSWDIWCTSNSVVFVLVSHPLGRPRL